ncbi:enoyl-CoA hydratase-related protein [Sphingomonas immobilis]|uniref:Enoyl-CoA hydratase-related protein n=1 Tax=Sphingomonas immobilis TaxID=3063997 RepID=A0ABT8ZXZ7_9SPHN|nr:enoyl-CoA hydratase-related protein [Sphingomonas sp. CA1-15]MDO7842087.1 enoyl-CoA hydratase-related protein [Sphingomonas sp. CA1-15]
MTYEKILYEITDDVAVIKLNDPTTLNAMTTRMGEELLDALWRGEREARAIMLGSVGRGFCSGANLAEGGIDLNDKGRDMGGRLDGIFNPVVYQMRASKAPVVTAVRGAAAGVGCGIALAGDMIVAGTSGAFLMAFRNVGLASDGGASYFLTRAIGRVRAMEMMLLGKKLPAESALEWGLINRVVTDEEVDGAAFELAKQLSQGPSSLGIIKQVAWSVLDASFETALSNERVAQRDAGRTEDFNEGVAAFREKRPAVFKGK